LPLFFPLPSSSFVADFLTLVFLSHEDNNV